MGARDVNVRDASCRSGARPLFWESGKRSEIAIIQIDYGITDIVELRHYFATFTSYIINYHDDNMLLL